MPKRRLRVRGVREGAGTETVRGLECGTASAIERGRLFLMCPVCGEIMVREPQRTAREIPSSLAGPTGDRRGGWLTPPGGTASPALSDAEHLALDDLYDDILYDDIPPP